VGARKVQGREIEKRRSLVERGNVRTTKRGIRATATATAYNDDNRYHNRLIFLFDQKLADRHPDPTDTPQASLPHFIVVIQYIIAYNTDSLSIMHHAL
jgi:hypothetical protein